MDLQWTPGCNFARQDPIFILAAILWSQTLHESRLSKHLQRIYLLSSLFTQNDITIICSYFIFVSRLTNYVGNCLPWTKIRRVRTISPTDFTFPQSRHFVFYRVATILTKWTLFLWFILSDEILDTFVTLVTWLALACQHICPLQWPLVGVITMLNMHEFRLLFTSWTLWKTFDIISLNLWFYNVSVIFLRLHVMTINNYVFFYFQFLFQNKWTLYTVDKIEDINNNKKLSSEKRKKTNNCAFG